MTYVNVFGGSTVRPSEVSYNAITMMVSTALEWPSLTATGTVASRILEVTAGAGLSLAMPPADQVSNGQDILIRNPGANTFTVTDTGGNTITTVSSGESKYIYLQDNSTINGTWTTVAFGVGASTADAAALAGYGLLAIGGTLNQSMPCTISNGNFTIGSADRGRLYLDSLGAAISLPSAAGAGDNFFFALRNISGGSTVVTPNGGDLIDAVGSLTLSPDESVLIVCTGAAWYSVGRGRSTTFSYTQLVKNVAGGVDVALTGAEAGYKIMKFTGLLTANINIIVPNVTTVWYVDNATTGAYSLLVKTLAGTGVSVAANERVILYCDGTNVLDAQTVFTTSGTFGAGSAGVPSISFALDPNTGFYNAAANQIGVTANGSNVGTWSAAGLSLVAPLAVASGGTGSATAAGALSNLGAAAAGVNNDITQLTALTKITIPTAGAYGFWSDGATYSLPVGNINKIEDRLFIGDAANFDAKWGGSVNNYSPVPRWLSRDSQLLVQSSVGRQAIAGLSKTSLSTTGNVTIDAASASAIGVIGVAIADTNFASTTRNAWGGYFEAWRATSVTNAVFGAEIDVGNDGADQTNQTPFNPFGSGAFGLNISAGGSKGVAYANPSSCALVIGNNTQTFNKGFVFGATAITGTDGLTGTGVAIALAKGHALSWYTSDGNVSSNLFSSVAAAANKVSIEMTDNIVRMIGSGSNELSTFENVASSVNYLRHVPAITGNPCELRAGGTDTDVDLLLSAKGAGNVRFGTWTTNVDAAVNGYITVKAANGVVKKLATIA